MTARDWSGLREAAVDGSRDRLANWVRQYRGMPGLDQDIAMTTWSDPDSPAAELRPSDIEALLDELDAAREALAMVDALADDCQHSRQARGEDPVITTRDGVPVDVEAALRAALAGVDR